MVDLQNELKRRQRRRRLLAARRYRSRLFWRTISHRRRLIGILVLVLLVTAIGTVYYFTRTRRVERLAEEYLTSLTGRKVKLSQAQFSPFEGIRLKKLRVWPPGDTEGNEEDAVFKADEVLLELEPGSLLTGRLKVTRIVAVRPEARRIEGPGPEEPSYLRQNKSARLDFNLPPIELREGRFVVITRLPGQEPIKTYEVVAFTADLKPDAKVANLYHISGRGGRAHNELIPISGNISLNPLRCETNIVVVKNLDQLPRQIEQIIEQYHIDFAKVKMRGGFDADSGELLVQFDCQGTQMTLPLATMLGWENPNPNPNPNPSLKVPPGPHPGGAASASTPGPGTGRLTEARDFPLKLTDVQGRITLRVVLNQASPPDQSLPPGQITFGEPDDQAAPTAQGRALNDLRRGWQALGWPNQPLRGKLNGQPFALTGHYDGFSADAAFEASVSVKGLAIPRENVLLAHLPGWAADIYADYDPTGLVDVELTARRPQRGAEVDVHGQVRLLDCAGRFADYPYPVEHAAGTVEFDNRQVRLDLAAHHGPATITVTGWAGTHRPWPIDLRVVGKDVPVDAEAFAGLAVEHPDEVDSLRYLHVQDGQADFTCHVTKQDRPGSHWETSVMVDRIHGVNLVYDRFNYPLQILEGQAEPTGRGVRLSRIQAIPRHLIHRPRPDQPTSRPQIDSSARLMADGFIGQAEHGESDVQLQVACSALPLDETLWRAMPPDVAAELLKYHIEARAEVFGTIAKRPGKPLDFTFSNTLQGGYLKADDFPYPLDSLAGKVRITPQRIQFDNVSGRHNAVPIYATGQIGLTTTQPTDLTIRTANQPLPLDDELKAALSPGARKTWEQLRPTGVITVEARLTQPAASQPEAGAGTTSAIRTGAGNGTIPGTVIPTTPGPGTARLTNSPSPRGEGRGEGPETTPGPGTARLTERNKRPPMTTVITVTALGNGLCYSEFPYPLEHVTGQMIFYPDRVELRDMVEQSGGRVIKASGTIWPGRDNLNLPAGSKPLPMVDLKVLATNLSFDEPLRRAVPWQIRKMWNDALPRGQFDAQLDRLRLTPLGPANRWDYAGRLDLRNVRGTFGVSLDQVTGFVSGAGTIIPGREGVFVGKMRLSEAVIADRLVHNLACADIQFDPAGKLHLEKLSAQMYGGSVDGFAEIGLTNPDLPYKLELAAQDIDLDQLVNFGKPQKDRIQVAGKLTGRFELEGNANTAARRGDGDLVLTHAAIYQVPAILSVVGDNADRKTKNPNQAAEIVFYLTGNRLVFDQITLRDPAISLMGTGTMDLSSKTVDLMFVTGQPSPAARGGLKVLEELLSGAGEELMKYHISGPWSKPRAEAVSLGTLREAIEKLTQARQQYLKPTPVAPPGPSPIDTAPLPGIQPTTPGGK